MKLDLIKPPLDNKVQDLEKKVGDNNLAAINGADVKTYHVLYKKVYCEMNSCLLW